MKTKRGFELIKTKGIKSNLNVIELEKNIDFVFPPLYKLFMENFELGSENPLKCEMYFDDKNSNYFYASGVIYEPLKDDEKWFLSISYFDEINKIVDNWTQYLRYEKEWMEFKFVRIANIGQGGGLFVSTRQEDADAIYQVVWDFEEPYFKVANDIFELMRGFVEFIPDKLQTDVDASLLCKNWEEDFWRVR